MSTYSRALEHDSGTFPDNFHVDLSVLRSVMAVCNLAESATMQGLNLQNNQKFRFLDALQLGLGLDSAGLEGLETQISSCIQTEKAADSQILLVLDGVDFVLAATDHLVQDILDFVCVVREVSRLLPDGPSLECRGRDVTSYQQVSATIVSVSADFPLLQVQHTPLEVNHASFVMSISHQSTAMWAVRELDTGSAKDVSGVLRITKGPAVDENKDEDPGNNTWDEKEVLYHVAGDGGVRVFERGAS